MVEVFTPEEVDVLIRRLCFASLRFPSIGDSRAFLDAARSLEALKGILEKGPKPKKHYISQKPVKKEKRKMSPEARKHISEGRKKYLKEKAAEGVGGEVA